VGSRWRRCAARTKSGKSDPDFSGISTAKSDAELLALAEEPIYRKTKPFDAATFEDCYAEGLGVLVESAEAEEAPAGAEAIDLMAALKKSLKQPAAVARRTTVKSKRKAAAPRRKPKAARCPPIA